MKLVSYFGGKAYLLEKLATPRYSLIVEPFGGFGAYSLNNPTHKVWWNEKNPQIVRIFQWIKTVSKKEIRELPIIPPGSSLLDPQFDYLSEPARDFMGFLMGDGNVAPTYKMSDWQGSKDRIERGIEALLLCHEHVSHWEITNLDYSELPNLEATWFVDPPPQYHGGSYPYGGYDRAWYERLGEWCLSRKGQVIVCEREAEGEHVSWLPWTGRIRVPFVTPKQSKGLMDLIYHRSDKKVGFGF